MMSLGNREGGEASGYQSQKTCPLHDRHHQLRTMAVVRGVVF